MPLLGVDICRIIKDSDRDLGRFPPAQAGSDYKQILPNLSLVLKAPRLRRASACALMNKRM